MNTRCLIELVIVKVGLDLALISPTLFSMMDHGARDDLHDHTRVGLIVAGSENLG
jgi:hypothetical protein